MEGRAGVKLMDFKKSAEDWIIRNNKIEFDCFSYIDFISKDVGFLDDKGLIFKTVDGGINWTKIKK